MYPRELSLVSQIKESTDAILGVEIAIILNEPKSAFDVSRSF